MEARRVSGYNWVSVVSLFCYVFLLLTFLINGKSEKVFSKFMLLMTVMIVWVGGSVAMRAELWPGINFWHHVSVGGMVIAAGVYFLFIVDFLEDKHTKHAWIWCLILFALFIFDCVTCFFIPEPVHTHDAAGSAQFVYNYTWHFYLLLVFILACVAHICWVVYRHCKGNRIAFRQLRPVLIGIAVLFVGHLLASLPSFSGVPLDIISGVFNAVLVFYALYKKRLFKMSLLFSKSNCIVLALLVGLVLGVRFFRPMQAWLESTFGTPHVGAAVCVAVVLLLVMIGLFVVFSLIFRAVFSRRATRRSEKLARLGDDALHMLNNEDIMTELTNTVSAMTRIDRLMIFLRQTDGDFRVEHTSNPLDEKNFYIRADHPIATWFRAHNECLSVRDFSRSTGYRSLWDSEKQMLHTLEAEEFVPMLAGGELVGMILLPKKKDGAPYAANTLETVREACERCAGPVRDAVVYERSIEEARKDKLTGLINRKYFFEVLDRQFEEFKDTMLSLCLFNLDDFKAYNQVYGVQEGDLALQRVAGILSSSVNEACTAARIGGKEFALILPGYDIHFAKLITENIVEEIGRINDRSGGQIGNSLKVSAGICAAPYMATSARELFQNAETAVYNVKRSGKNAVQIYSSSIYYQTERQYKFSGGYRENASTIYALTAAIDAKDHYTFRHSQNVAYYCEEIGRAAGLSGDLIEILKEAASLHDIGKIGIREEILNKPDNLTPDEFAIMKSHVESAVNIIRHLPSLDYVIPTILSHHERYDGRGYPQRLKGEEIPIMGRILCIADSFDAMTSERNYKKPLGLDEAIKNLQHEAGGQFDPKLVLIFIDELRRGRIKVLGNADATPPLPSPAPTSPVTPVVKEDKAPAGAPPEPAPGA
jgi:diguanylate cyclase (GGDEF)-like protein